MPRIKYLMMGNITMQKEIGDYPWKVKEKVILKNKYIYFI
jgi:hypothetical protein